MSRYFVCDWCTAKWSAPLPAMRCPRCGTFAQSSELADPSWQRRVRSPRKETGMQLLLNQAAQRQPWSEHLSCIDLRTRTRSDQSWYHCTVQVEAHAICVRLCSEQRISDDQWPAVGHVLKQTTRRIDDCWCYREERGFWWLANRYFWGMTEETIGVAIVESAKLMDRCVGAVEVLRQVQAGESESRDKTRTNATLYRRRSS